MASQSLKQKYSTNEEVVMAAINALTAHAGGGQGSATAMPNKWNRFDTIANDLDSGLLKAALIGMKQVAFNNTAATTNKILSIYPQTGEKVNGTTNKRCDIPAGKAGVFESFENGNWAFYLSDLSSLVFEVVVSLTSNQLKNLNTTPIDAIPAPGVGFAIEMISGSGKYTKATINYAAGGAIGFISESAGANNFQLTDPTSPAVQTATYFKKYSPASGDVIENKKMQIKAVNANYINGDGTYKCYGIYRIITV